jgi:hypothetical protein
MAASPGEEREAGDARATVHRDAGAALAPRWSSDRLHAAPPVTGRVIPGRSGARLGRRPRLARGAVRPVGTGEHVGLHKLKREARVREPSPSGPGTGKHVPARPHPPARPRTRLRPVPARKPVESLVETTEQQAPCQKPPVSLPTRHGLGSKSSDGASHADHAFQRGIGGPSGNRDRRT